MSAQPQVKELIGYSFLIGFANDHVFDARELISSGKPTTFSLAEPALNDLNQWSPHP